GLVMEENPSFTMESCDTRTGYFSTSNRVICVPPGGSLTIDSAVTNLAVIADISSTVTIDAPVGSPTDDLVKGITVVAGKLLFGGRAAFYGTNTLVAFHDIEFGKNVISHDDVAR